MSVTAPGSPVAPTHDSGARIIPIPPPVYYALGFIAGLGLRAATTPLAIGARPVSTAVGAGILALGAAVALAGVAAVVRHRTTIVPHHAVSVLLTHGAYRFSRNPMYVGLAIAYVGGTLLTGTWWPLVTLPLVLLVVRYTVIEPEERYLGSRFGQGYADYRKKTGRWL